MEKNKEQTIRAKVKRLGVCAYRIESRAIRHDDGAQEKRRGFIIENDGEALVIPFKKGKGERSKAHKVRESQHGTLKLSPARQKVTLSISFDREADSVESFTEEFHRLIDGYVLDLLDFEVRECLRD